MHGAEAPCYSSHVSNRERSDMGTKYEDLPPENLRNLLRVFRNQNKRKPTRATMAEIRKIQAALKGKS